MMRFRQIMERSTITTFRPLLAKNGQIGGESCIHILRGEPGIAGKKSCPESLSLSYATSLRAEWVEW